MSSNRAVTYVAPGQVEVRDIEYPSFELRDGPGVHPANVGRKVPHGVILKVLATNICGSDQHMVRGRTTAPEGLVLGHEITGEVVEVGPDVEFVHTGDVVSVPFNIACGRCRNCKAGHTGVCLNVNPDRPGSAYGYVDMGGWVGGQAARVGSLSLRLGLGWAKSLSFTTGQCPVMRYNHGLMMSVLSDKAQIARNVGAVAIALDSAAEGYAAFDQGAARKYVLDPHGLLAGRTTL